MAPSVRTPNQVIFADFGSKLASAAATVQDQGERQRLVESGNALATAAADALETLMDRLEYWIARAQGVGDALAIVRSSIGNQDLSILNSVDNIISLCYSNTRDSSTLQERSYLSTAAQLRGAQFLVSQAVRAQLAELERAIGEARVDVRTENDATLVAEGFREIETLGKAPTTPEILISLGRLARRIELAHARLYLRRLALSDLMPSGVHDGQNPYFKTALFDLLDVDTKEDRELAGSRDTSDSSNHLFVGEPLDGEGKTADAVERSSDNAGASPPGGRPDPASQAAPSSLEPGVQTGSLTIETKPSRDLLFEAFIERATPGVQDAARMIFYEDYESLFVPLVTSKTGGVHTAQEQSLGLKLCRDFGESSGHSLGTRRLGFSPLSVF